MRKLLLIAFLTVIIISGLTLVSTAHFSTVHASTDVTGIISSDITWTKANSPYDLTGPLLVNGLTLTIEPGVTVNLHGYYLQVNGTLRARGSATDQIYVYGNVEGNKGIILTESSTSWNEQTGSGSIIENASLTSTGIRIINASPKINGNTINGDLIVQEGSPVILNNIVKGGITASGTSSIIIWNNTITGSWKGVSLHASGNGAVVSGNTISGCQTGIAVFQYGNPKIERNLITSNTKGIAIARQALLASEEPYIENNTITNNSVGISITPFMNYAVSAKINNNIYANDNNNLNSEVSNEIDATYNWWGTTDVQSINDTIHDIALDFTGGTVKFVPFLTEPNPQARPDPNALTPTLTPTPPPTDLPSTSPTPSQEPQQTDQTKAIIGAAIAVTVIGAGLGLLIYLIKRK